LVKRERFVIFPGDKWSFRIYGMPPAAPRLNFTPR
jgi:hypothetical protein